MRGPEVKALVNLARASEYDNYPGKSTTFAQAFPGVLVYMCAKISAWPAWSKLPGARPSVRRQVGSNSLRTHRCARPVALADVPGRERTWRPPRRSRPSRCGLQALRRRCGLRMGSSTSVKLSKPAHLLAWCYATRAPTSSICSPALFFCAFSTLSHGCT